ncbi:MAG: hypothetical protein N3F07_03275 [Candidatus Micrarchaeota archaeon]|nr:hypothetical protein [Candidatus Micrarchaeota archaeon]
MRVPASLPLFFLLLVLPISHSINNPEDWSFKTIITVISQSEYNITAKITYFNLSYFSKFNQEEIKREPFRLDPNKKTSFDYVSTGFFPLNDSPIFFTFEGRNVSLDGSSPACNPSISDADGKVECRFTYYQNESGGFVPMEQRTSCGTLTLTYKGEFRGSDEYKPSSASLVICPRNNAAISALGPALISAIGSPSNIGVCLPALVLSGLLIASMYYSGRNPLSLFDLTTPRLPKTKHARISGGSTAMAIRTAATRYMQAKKKAQKEATNLLKKIARKSGKSWGERRRAKKELSKLFEDLDEELKKNPNGLNENTLNNYRMRLHDIFSKYGLPRDEEHKNFRKLYGRYHTLVFNLFNTFYLSDVAMKQMSSTRSPGGGKFKKWLDKKQAALTEKLVSFESGLQKIPGYKILRFTPLLYPLSLPKAVLDVIAQRRSAKAYAKAVQRRILGHVPYVLLTRKVKDGVGERELNWLGEQTKKLFDKGPLKWWANYFDWSFDGFIERHNIHMRQAVHLFDADSKYARQLAEAMNTASVLALREIMEMELAMHNMLAEKKKMLEMMKASASKSKLAAEFEKIENHLKEAQAGNTNLLDVCRMLQKHGDAKQKAMLADFETKLKQFGSDYQAIRQMEQKIMAEYGIFMKLQGLYSDLTFDNLRDIARKAEFDAVENARKRGVVVAKSEEYIRSNRAEIEKAIENALPAAMLKRLGLSGSALYSIILKDRSNDQKERAEAEAEFRNRVLKPIIGNRISQLNLEINEEGQLTRQGILSKYVEAVEALGKKANPNGPVIGKDPAGTILFSHLESLAKATGSPELLKFFQQCKIENISDFETLYAKGASNRELARLLTAAINSARDDTNGIRRIAEVLAVGMKTVEGVHRELLAILENRAKIANGLARLSEEEIQKLCARVGVRPDPHTGARPSVDEIIEGLSRLPDEKVSDRWRLKSISRKLGVSVQELQESSILSFTMVKLLEKTQVGIEKWGAKILSSGKAGSESDFRQDFKNYVGAHQAFEYAALRKKFNFNQYEGEMAQHIETMLYMIRRYNKGAEFALTKALNENVKKKSGADIYLSNNAGGLLGSYESVFKNTVYAFAAERVFYKNITSPESKAYDKSFAKKMSDFGAKAGEFDAAAYMALQSRGILFRDIKRVPYSLTADNSGAIPLLEFDSRYAVSKDFLLRKDANIKKGSIENQQDYGPLLSRMRVSDFGSEIIGLVAVRNQGDEHHEHWHKVNPADIKGLNTIFMGSRAEPSKRGIYSNAIAGLDAEGNRASKPILRFLQNSDYVENHLGKGWQFYHRTMERIGAFSYMLMYDDLKNSSYWYAAQARARHALYELARVASNWMTPGANRLDPEKLFEANEFYQKFDPNFSYDKKRMLQTLMSELEDLGTLKNGKKKSEVLRELILKMGDNPKAEWLRRNYAYINKEAAGFESIAFGAKMGIEALKEMYAKNMIDKAQFDRLSIQFREIQKMAQADFKASAKMYEEFNKAVIGYTGSHSPHTYYGSVRNIFTMSGLFPAFDFKQGFIPGFFMSIESTAMRDADYNRGGRKGAEYYEMMNMNTGQGIYENPRWWAASIYEQRMILPLMFAHFVHRTFLPLAAGFYRSQIGLSSYLQRTEIETEWGKPRVHLLWLLGLGRGTNDILGATVQEVSDFTGVSDALAALRKIKRVEIDKDGNVYAEQSPVSKFVQRWAVESKHVNSSSQWAFQNRIQDRLLSSKEWADNQSLVYRNGEKIYYNPNDLSAEFSVGRPRDENYKEMRIRDAVSMWPQLFDASRFSKGAEKEVYEQRLRELEGYLNPFASKIIDERPEGNQLSRGVGSFFNKDGSRDRFMEIFQRDHANTWRQVIPGMTEVDPEGNVFISATTAHYYERGDSGRMKLMKDMYSVGYNEAEDRFFLFNQVDTHRDAFRDTMRLDTPAMMQLLKFQSYVMRYEMFKPITSSLRSAVPFGLGDWAYEKIQSRKSWTSLSESERQSVNAQLERYGANLDYVQEMLNRKAHNWHYFQEEKERLGVRPLAKIYNRYVERMRWIALASTEQQRNINVMRRQRLLHELDVGEEEVV